MCSTCFLWDVSQVIFSLLFSFSLLHFSCWHYFRKTSAQELVMPNSISECISLSLTFLILYVPFEIFVSPPPFSGQVFLLLYSSKLLCVYPVAPSFPRLWKIHCSRLENMYTSFPNLLLRKSPMFEDVIDFFSRNL